MATPLTNAANLGGSLVDAPITVELPPLNPSDFVYVCKMSAVWSFEPASAKPMPSKSDFFPRSITSGGISANCVCTTNSATYLVRPAVLGKGTEQDEGTAESADPAADFARTPNPAPMLIEVRKKSRLLIRPLEMLTEN